MTRLDKQSAPERKRFFEQGPLKGWHDATEDRFPGRRVVITGASSGLGRLTALRFAEEGARVAVIARGEEGLRTLQREIEDMGSECLTIRCDVSDEKQMRMAASHIASRFGGIDVWVNNAAVSLYGEIDKVPVDEMRRLMDVNFFGQVNGLQAALPYLDESAKRGRKPVLIGVLSGLARSSVPLQGAYVAAKHALYGFYETLRQELKHRHSKVAVSLILPSTIDTPLFIHAKSYLGVRPRGISPIYPVERFADAILDLSEKPKRAHVEGGFAKLAIFLQTFFPGFYEWWQARNGYSSQMAEEPKSLSDPDDLFSPMPGTGQIHGKDPVAYRYDRMERAIPWLLVGSALIGIGWGAGSHRHRKPVENSKAA